MKTTNAAKRRGLLAEHAKLWKTLLGLRHRRLAGDPNEWRCEPGCAACPKQARLSARLERKRLEIRALEREILDGGKKRGTKSHCTDLDILLACLNTAFTNDEQRGKSVSLSASAFAKRKANLSSQFAAIISG